MTNATMPGTISFTKLLDSAFFEHPRYAIFILTSLSYRISIT